MKFKSKLLVQEIKIIFQNFNWKLYFPLLIIILLPSIYKTVRFYIIGSLEQDNIYSISSQLLWVNLVQEILQEFFIMPIFFVLESKAKNIDINRDYGNKLKTGSIFIFLIYLIFGIIIYFFAYDLCKLMHVNQDIILETVQYVRWEIFSFLFLLLFTFSLTFLEIKQATISLYIISFINLGIFVFFDFFLLSNFPFSANLGVIGIAISNIIVNLIMLIIVNTFLYFHKINFFVRYWSLRWILVWIKKGSLTGLESLIRNVIFSLVVVRIANMVSNNGTYWVLNNFIWQWLLLPSIVLNKLIQKETSENKYDDYIKRKGYFLFASLLVALWLLTIPIWPYFIQYIMNYKDYQLITYLALIQTPFYLTFILNNVMDSVFLGKGKITYLLIQSILINIVYYSIAFMFFHFKVVNANIENLSLMFGIGMALDIIPTSIQYYIFRKKEQHTWIYKTWFKRFEKKTTNGMSTPNVSELFKIFLYRPLKEENILSNNFLLFLEKENFSYSQRYLGQDQLNRCVYKYEKGITLSNVNECSDEQIKEIINIVNQLQNISLKFNDENKIYSHGDLSPKNVVFNNKGEIKTIIDWDSIRVGDRLDDICYILWTWINLGSLVINNEIKINRLIKFINYLELSNVELKNLKQKFITRMKLSLKDMNTSMPHFERTYEWVEYSVNWINKNWDKIESNIKWN